MDEKIREAANALAKHIHSAYHSWLTGVGVDDDCIHLLTKKKSKEADKIAAEGWQGYPIKVVVVGVIRAEPARPKKRRR